MVVSILEKEKENSLLCYVTGLHRAQIGPKWLHVNNSWRLD